MMNTSIPALTSSLKEEVDALFAEWDKPNSPGCALGIIREGKLIYSRGYGMANLEHDVPITTRTVFRIASTSKQFTAACIGLLVESGEISLDDDIRSYLPELPVLGSRVTVRHLLHHTSGWRDYIELMELRGMGDDDFYTDDEVLELLARQQKLNFETGEDYLYSNTGYYLLGVIVQRVSGLSLRKYAEENIFKPLEMANTHFHNDHTEVVKGLAQGYSPREGGGYKISMTTLDLVGDGGIFTTVEDLYLWDQNFYTNRLGNGNAELLGLLQRTGMKNNGESLTYALGLEVKDYKGLRIVCHSGAFVGYRAEMIRFPEVHFSVICLANLSSIDPSNLARRTADLFLEGSLQEGGSESSMADEVLIDIPESELVDKTGLYWNPAKDLILDISFEGGELQVEVAGRRFEVKPSDSAHFLSQDPLVDVELRFERKRTDSDWRLYFKEEDDEPFLMTRLQAVEHTPEQLVDYAGRFYSQELDVIYKLVLTDGALVMKHRNAPREVLKPGLKDVFWVGSLILRFTRGIEDQKDGPVTGFKLSSGRVKEIIFQKMI